MGVVILLIGIGICLFPRPWQQGSRKSACSIKLKISKRYFLISQVITCGTSGRARDNTFSMILYVLWHIYWLREIETTCCKFPVSYYIVYIPVSCYIVYIYIMYIYIYIVIFVRALGTVQVALWSPGVLLGAWRCVEACCAAMHDPPP